MPHQIFTQFDRFRGVVPPGFQVNFLGVMTRNAFTTGLTATLGQKFSDPGEVHADYPGIDEEYFEWIDLLEAVLEAADDFTMIELGAGYGRWLVNAAIAARQRRGDIRIKLVGVEAEPTHYAWMMQHFRDNGLDPLDHTLLEAAVDADERVVRFYAGKPDEWYGQRIADHGDTDREVRDVETVSLSHILADLETVDLIDLDIEGAELSVLASAIADLDRKVKRVHIGTHATDLEVGLRTLFREHGWYKRNDFGVGVTEITAWGPIFFGNGVQSWINPRLADVQATAAELSWLQWSMRSAEMRFAKLVDQMNTHEVVSDRRDQQQTAAPTATTEPEGIAGLEAALDAVREARARIAAMESSKFWRLRGLWFRLKRCVGLGMNE
jgi:FkbM family methyltransferase